MNGVPVQRQWSREVSEAQTLPVACWNLCVPTLPRISVLGVSCAHSHSWFRPSLLPSGSCTSWRWRIQQCSRTPWLALTVLASKENRPSNVKVQLCAQVYLSKIRAAFFFLLPAYFYILLFLINPVLYLFLKFPEKMSLTFWNSVSGRCDNGDAKDLLCHFIWGAAEWSPPGRLHPVKPAPTIWSGGPTQSPPPRAFLFWGKDPLWIPGFCSGLNWTSL